jgi:CRP/FNR family cyclic AMP-dependent transcriptional regulator
MTDEITALQLLQGVDIFQGVSDQILDDLIKTTRTLAFEKGDAVFSEGEAGAGMYLVIGGAVELNKAVTKGQQQRLALLDRGQIFGELSLFDNLPRSATATAFVTSSLLFFPAEAFHTLLDDRPGFAPFLLRNLVTKLSLRLRDADEEIRELSRAGAR